MRKVAQNKFNTSLFPEKLGGPPGGGNFCPLKRSFPLFLKQQNFLKFSNMFLTKLFSGNGAAEDFLYQPSSRFPDGTCS
jgi:hypothetical protein